MSLFRRKPKEVTEEAVEEVVQVVEPLKAKRTLLQDHRFVPSKRGTAHRQEPIGQGEVCDICGNLQDACPVRC